MEKQVNWRALSELRGYWPDRGGWKAMWHGGERQSFVSRRSFSVMGFIDSGVRSTEAGGGWKEEGWAGGSGERCISSVWSSFSPSTSFCFPPSLSGSGTGERASLLPTPIFLCVFSVLNIWVRQNAKSIMLFLPHFLFDATSKGQQTALPRPTEKKASGTKHSQNESTKKMTSPFNLLNHC